MNGHIIWGVRFLDLLTGPCWPSWPIGGGVRENNWVYVIIQFVDNLSEHQKYIKLF